MFLMSFHPKQVVKRLLSVLPERAREVLRSRYGLASSTDRMTLESIGKKYGITRERVRQIENYALANIRKSPAYQKERLAFEELERTLQSMGGIVVEYDLLDQLSKDKSTQNYMHFLLVLGESFKRKKEDDEFRHRWYMSDDLAEKVHGALRRFYSNISDNALIPEGEVVGKFFEHLKDVSDEFRQEEIAKRWLRLSKKVDKNPLGEWGLAHSSNVRAKGMRDYAFLVIRKHGSPLHFTQVAKSIEKLFGKKAHVATCHNELIKDPRFVLVGRGLYALSEWGYMTGVVKDVIHKILEKNGPLTKPEVVDKVLKERYVKENTIVVNLQNPKYFRRDKEGRYHLVS